MAMIISPAGQKTKKESKENNTYNYRPQIVCSITELIN